MKTASSISLTKSDPSKSLVKTTSASVSLRGGSSSNLTTTSSGTANVGRLGQKVATARALAAPLVGGAVVGAVAGGFYGISNMIKYARNKKSGKQAAKDTVAGSAGMGIAAGLGIAATNAVAGTWLALGSTVIVPLSAGVATACASIKVWNKLFFKKKTPSKTK